MLGSSFDDHVSCGSLRAWVGLVALLPSLALAGSSKGTGIVASRPKPAPCRSSFIAPSAAATPELKAGCARSVAVAACRTGDHDDDVVALSLSKKFGLPELLLKKGLGRLNSTAGSRKGWCDLKVGEFKEILAYAAESEEEFSEAREEWIRFTMGDEKGTIPPGGLARALEQRRALTRERDGVVRAQRVVQSALAALPSNPAGWTNLTGYVHPVGRMNDLLIHPTSTNTMWAGADGGGIWKTTDGGATWAAVNDFLGSLSVSSFAMRPGDPSTIYAATGAQGSHTGAGGAGIFKSIDGGTTWSLSATTDPASNPDFQYVYKLAIHPSDSNTVMAATSGGAYITTNGGTSWNKVAAAATTARNVAIHPSNGSLRVIAMDNGTVKIATDGVTYNSFAIATVTGSSYTRIALAPSDQSIMYALVQNSGTSQLYRSSTGGTTWTVVAPPVNTLKGYLGYTGGIWVDPTNANHIAIDEYWGAVTSDASVPSPTWLRLCCGWVDFHGVVSHPGYNGSSNKTVFFFDDGGLYRWTDVDTVNTVQPSYLSPNGIVVTEAYTVAGRGGNLIFGAQDVASRYYRPNAPSDLTQKWRFASLGGHDGAATAADRTNPNILYGSTQFLGIHRSLDGGLTNAFICNGITDISCGNYSGTSAFIAPFVLDPNNQSRMLAGAASLWRSNDVSSGAPPTWTAIQTGVGSNISAIAVAPTDSNVIWVAYQNGSVYKTGNGTVASPTWSQVTTAPSGNKLRIYIDRTNASRVYIGLSGFFANRLVTTPDGGTTWSNVAGLPSASVFAIQQHPSISSWLYAGTAVGLFASEDGGLTWSTSNQGPANVQVRDLNWYSDAPAVLLIGTFGRGIWRATLNVTQVSTTTTVASSSNPSANGSAVTFTATVTSGATGTVTFKDGTTTLGSGTISGSTATYATSTLTAGSHSITAVYSGDTNYAGSTSAALTQTVNGATSHGDVNGDGQVTVSDVFYLINYLFAGGPSPIGSGDANGDGSVTVSDVFYLINYLFAGGPAPI